MKKHIFNIFPEMIQEDYQRLRSDIQQNGYDIKNPIWLYNGEILDGWNRQKVCNEVGKNPVYKDFIGSDQEAISFVMRTNKRRNLTSSQWACIATDAEALIEGIRAKVEQERKEKQIGNAANQYSEPCDNKLTQPKIPERTDQKVSEMFNTNRTYINEAAKLKETKPEVFEQVKRGEKTFTEVNKEKKKDELQQRKNEYFERIDKHELNEQRVDIFNTTKKFRIICADPPWSYNDKCEGGGVQTGGVELRHYNVMSTKDICNLPIKDITEKNSVLFLWVTSPLLPDGLKVIESWGFEYKTSFVWDKVKHNMGHYNSVRHEFLLIATKGSCTPDNKILYDSVQSIEKTDKHSEKPKEFLNIIDDLYTFGERIELFCRSNEKDNWLIWGNEI